MWLDERHESGGEQEAGGEVHEGSEGQADAPRAMG